MKTHSVCLFAFTALLVFDVGLIFYVVKLQDERDRAERALEFKMKGGA